MPYDSTQHGVIWAHYPRIFCQKVTLLFVCAFGASEQAETLSVHPVTQRQMPCWNYSSWRCNWYFSHPYSANPTRAQTSVNLKVSGQPPHPPDKCSPPVDRRPANMCLPRTTFLAHTRALDGGGPAFGTLYGGIGGHLSYLRGLKSEPLQTTPWSLHRWNYHTSHRERPTPAYNRLTTY